MKIIREISAIQPEKCRMIAKGFFGNIKGEVKYSEHHKIKYNTGYLVIVDNKQIGEASEFIAACDMLLQELKVVRTFAV